MAEWEEKYIFGEIKRFDQKNTMFNRPGWDSEINSLIDNWTISSDPKDQKGFMIEEKALSIASRLGTMMGIFNISKPNAPEASKKLMEKIMVNTSEYDYKCRNDKCETFEKKRGN